MEREIKNSANIVFKSTVLSYLIQENFFQSNFWDLTTFEFRMIVPDRQSEDATSSILRLQECYLLHKYRRARERGKFVDQKVVRSRNGHNQAKAVQVKNNSS